MSANAILKAIAAVVFAIYELYWLAAAYTAARSKPRRKRPSLLSNLEFYLFSSLEVLLFAQLIGLQVLPFRSSVSVPILGLALFVLGVSVSTLGRLALGTNWASSHEYQIKTDQTLVTSGVYRYIRHPIYVGVFLVYTGGGLVAQSYLFLFYAVLFVAIGHVWAKREEALLAGSFGSAYMDYIKHTKRFIPFVY